MGMVVGSRKCEVSGAQRARRPARETVALWLSAQRQGSCGLLDRL